MGEKVTETRIDVTDIRKRYLVNRQAPGLDIKGVLRFESLENPIAKVLKDADRLRDKAIRS